MFRNVSVLIVICFCLTNLVIFFKVRLFLILFFSNLYSKFSNLQLVLFKLALILRRHVLRFLLLVLLFLDFLF